MKCVTPLKKILSIRENFSKEDRNLIKKAYNLSKKLHKEQKFDGTRYPYFLHPAYAGYLLAKWNQDAEAVCAALLHDVVEDCDTSLITIKNMFGQRVAFLVDGMSWEIKWSFKEKRYLKDWDGFFKKICRYAVQDPTIIILHCADERSKLKDITGRDYKKTDENLERTKKRYIRFLAFYVPLYNEIGLKNHAKRLYDMLYSVTRRDSKSKLFKYISKKDLKKIKNKLSRIKGVEELK